MAQFPALDPAGTAYDLHLWHPDHGSVHIWVGTPGHPDVASASVEATLRDLAETLVPQIGGSHVVEVLRFRTDKVPVAETTP